jgi:predicted transcriptional regulator
MNNTTKPAVLITLCCALLGSAGCTTMDSMDGTQEALAEEKIRVGDKVFLHYNNGVSEQVEITAIGDASVSGEAEHGEKIVANYEDLSSVGHKRVEVLKTVGATVGIIALSPIIIVGVVATGGGM